MFTQWAVPCAGHLAQSQPYQNGSSWMAARKTHWTTCAAVLLLVSVGVDLKMNWNFHTGKEPRLPMNTAAAIRGWEGSFWTLALQMWAMSWGWSVPMQECPQAGALEGLEDGNFSAKNDTSAALASWRSIANALKAQAKYDPWDLAWNFWTYPWAGGLFHTSGKSHVHWDSNQRLQLGSMETFFFPPSDLQPPADVICQQLSTWRKLQGDAQVFITPSLLTVSWWSLLHAFISSIHCSPFSWDGVVKSFQKHSVRMRCLQSFCDAVTVIKATAPPDFRAWDLGRPSSRSGEKW